MSTGGEEARVVGEGQNTHSSVRLRKRAKRARRVEEGRIAVVAAGDEPRPVAAHRELARCAAYLLHARRLAPEFGVRDRAAPRERVGLRVGDDRGDALLGQLGRRRVRRRPVDVGAEADDEGGSLRYRGVQWRAHRAERLRRIGEARVRTGGHGRARRRLRGHDERRTARDRVLERVVFRDHRRQVTQSLPAGGHAGDDTGERRRIAAVGVSPGVLREIGETVGERHEPLPDGPRPIEGRGEDVAGERGDRLRRRTDDRAVADRRHKAGLFSAERAGEPVVVGGELQKDRARVAGKLGRGVDVTRRRRLRRDRLRAGRGERDG